MAYNTFEFDICDHDHWFEEISVEVCKKFYQILRIKKIVKS